MSSSLQRFFMDQAAAGGLAFYQQKPILLTEVSGVIGRLNAKSDAKGVFYEIDFISSGENREYPKGAEIESVRVRQSDDVGLWSFVDNNMTLGRGKELLGFSTIETNLNAVGRMSRYTRETSYPNHKILALTIAFLEGGNVNYMLGTKIGLPQSVRDNPEWQNADQSPRVNLDIGV